MISVNKLLPIKLFRLNFLGGSKCVTKWQFLIVIILRHIIAATWYKATANNCNISLGSDLEITKRVSQKVYFLLSDL